MPDRERPPASPIAEVPSAAAHVEGEAALEGASLPAPTPPAENLSSVEGQPIPTYRTVFPEAASARYRVTRGARTGEGVLVWSPAPDAYRLTFDAPEVAWAQASEGAFDGAGLAPRRYVERTRRALTATNFDAEAGVIRYSASSARHAWLSGSQDRLGWLIQLGAVLAADPAFAEAGRRIVLPVAGVRGEAQRWEFVVRGLEPVPFTGDSARAVHLARQPASSRDLGLDVWIDPAMRALPLRVEWRTPLGGTVLTWQRMAP